MLFQTVALNRPSMAGLNTAPFSVTTADQPRRRAMAASIALDTLTAPSSRAQAELVADVLDRAELTAAEIDYVEAHGTGTAVGDPIEARALIEAAAVGRPGWPSAHEATGRRKRSVATYGFIRGVPVSG